MSGDSRKNFLLAAAANYFGVSAGDNSITSLTDSQALNSFLDDGNAAVLAGKVQSKGGGQRIILSNKVDSSDKKDRVIVFFKIRPDVITPDNLLSNIIVSSMVSSPLHTLYHAVQKIYAPLLLEGSQWSESLDSKLQSLLSELEAGLGTAIRKLDPSFKGKGADDSLGSILDPMDEFEYWQEMSRSGSKLEIKERAENFVELFKPISKDYGGLDSMPLNDAMELVELTQDTLDDVWKQTDFDLYSENRMRHLMDVIGGSLGRYVQRKLADEDLWCGKFTAVKESLNSAVTICERWVVVCETLTVQFWKRFGPHPWKGEKFVPDNLKKLSERLEEIRTLRTVHEQQMQLLSSHEQKELHTVEAFNPFLGLNPLQYNPYTQPLWAAAVAQYERAMSPSEQKIAGKLRAQFSGLDGNPQQLLREFQRYKELIKRPSISKAMVAERETLLGQLTVHVKQVGEDFAKCTGQRSGGKGIPKGKNLPDIVNSIVYVRQLEAKIEETLSTAESLLGDLNGFKRFRKDATDLHDELVNWRRDSFDEWSREIQSLIEDTAHPLSLETNGKLMELNHKTGKLHVNYGDRLVTLLREVRQLTSLGFAVPAKIQHVAATAFKFYRHGVILKQVAHFYNTIDQQMIPSQQSMMLESALAFERLIKNPKKGAKSKGDNVQITWDNPEELEGYIDKLQAVATRLTTENRKLRKSHITVCEKVQAMMNIDLLRQQQRWKDTLMDIRHLMANLVTQGFSAGNMNPWKAHWDRQLYKALEVQYQMALEGLNENLPEIRVELTYRQQRLQFRPPLEEIEAKYFREMKKFISIPNHFRGVGEATENLIFPAIIDRNAQGFITCYKKADGLFKRLSSAQEQFRDWVVLGALDLDQFVEDTLKDLSDWERNFKALKVRGRDAEKLPNEIKIDCITVNTTPVKSVIDDHIQRLFDALLNSLRKTINSDLATIDTFLTSAIETLSKRPQTVEDIGDANTKHTEFAKKRREVLIFY